MAYIGKTPTVGNFVKLDALTASATASYTMQLDSVNFSPESVNHMLVSLNGVIQAPTDSYTISGSTITFASALTSSDSIDFIMVYGNVLDIGTPSDNTVSLAKLTASGTKDATTFLRGDNTFATAGGDADNYFATSGLSSKDLGTGLHIKTADSGASVSANADELVIENGSGIAGISILTATDGVGAIAFGDSGDNDIGVIYYNHDHNRMEFHTNAVERLRIADNGEVSVNDGQVGTGAAVFKIKGAINNDVAIFTHGTSSSSNEVLFRFRDGSNTDCGTIGINPNSNTVAYNTSSDYRLKENATDIDDGIERLKQLKPYRFNWKSNSSGDKVDGFFAHEVSSIVPEAISGEKDGFEKYRENQEKPEDKNVGDFKLDENGEKIPEYQQIDQSKLVPLLTSALQEAITKIETLETRIEALENA